MTISGRRVARNAGLSFTAQVVPLLVGVLCIPFITRGMGAERFGILGIAWAVLGYFSLLDLGLSSASTRFVANALGRGAADRVPKIVWSAAIMQILIAVAGAALLLAIAPLLVRALPGLTGELRREALGTIRVLAGAIPVVFLSGSLKGVVEAAQRFGWIAAVQIPAGTLSFVVPLTGALLGWPVPTIVVLMVGARAIVLITYFLLATQVSPGLKALPQLDGSSLRDILPFGAWTTLSNVLSPIMTSLDRFLVGSLAGIHAAAYYTAPQELTLRLRALPTSLAATLFPAFASTDPASTTEGPERFYGQSIRFILFLLGPAALGMALAAPDILHVWLGPEYSAQGSTALRWLALGLVFNGVAYIPNAYLYGRNRPDLPAKFHIIEFPLFIGLAWLLIPTFGVAGAAAVWTLRVVLDSGLLLTAAHRIGATRSGLPPTRVRNMFAVLACAAALAAVFFQLPGNAAARVMWSIVASGALALAAWFGLLDPKERVGIRRLASRPLADH